jgi:hypothetical protein
MRCVWLAEVSQRPGAETPNDWQVRTFMISTLTWIVQPRFESPIWDLDGFHGLAHIVCLAPPISSEQY